MIQKLAKDKNYQKVKDHCHCTVKCRGAAHMVCNLRFNASKEIPIPFQNGSDYDYHFIILSECLAKNIKKYKTFSVLIQK